MNLDLEGMKRLSDSTELVDFEDEGFSISGSTAN